MLAILRRPARSRKAAFLLSAVLFLAYSPGCSALSREAEWPEEEVQKVQPRRFPAEPTAATVSRNAPGNGPIQVAAYQQPNPSSPDQRPANGAKESGEGYGKKEAGENKAETSQPKEKITLPMAIAMCVNNNFRVLAAAQQIRIAEGDLITSSLIPNPNLFADYQLIPLQHVDINNQLGPPEADLLCSIPIDWLLFGKRLAAMNAARLGVEVKNADFADTLRVQLSQTVDAFYEVLQYDAYFKLAEKNLEELTELEKITEDLAKNKKVGSLELDRIKLAVHEALLERHDRELALELAKARLRPFLGRTAADPDYEVEGSLTVTAVVTPPKLEEAVALAEANRPDLLSGRRAIDQATATVEQERRKAKPTLSVQPGVSYYNQHWMNGERNGPMFDIGISMSLPLTDRNQGNIYKAKAQVAERQFTYAGDRADALADVEASVASYDDAVEHLTQFNTRSTLKAAYDLRKDMDAAYRAGTRKLIDLLDAHRAYQSRLAHIIEFESDYWRTLNKLNAAVGLKAYDPEKGPTQPVKPVDGRIPR
jgi:cobalt-zinc-cadmium efflux system outer membrane protein